jgi:adenosylcobinamide-GDP ribazoletransferase
VSVAAADGATRRSPLAGAVAAFRFLTIIPVPGRSGTFSSAAAWFPAVGAFVGAISGGIVWIAGDQFGDVVGAALGVAALVVLTGALHQDALADCADGLGVSGDRERRQAVMSDPTIGTFGGLALIFWVLLLVSALARVHGGHAMAVLAAAGALARWTALLHTTLAAPARSSGLGASFAVSPRALVVATLSCGALALLPIQPQVAVAAALACVVGLISARWAERALGGRTGDTIGASIAVAEAVVCLVLGS